MRRPVGCSRAAGRPGVAWRGGRWRRPEGCTQGEDRWGGAAVWRSAGGGELLRWHSAQVRARARARAGGEVGMVMVMAGNRE